MSRPIKVPEELFEVLRTDAEAKGIPMQQALVNRLEQQEQLARAVASERDRLDLALKTKEKALTEARQTDSSHQSVIRKLEEERERLLRAIQATKENESELVHELGDLRRSHEMLDEAKREAEDNCSQARKQRNALLTLLTVVGMLALGVYVVHRFFPPSKPEEPAVPAIPEAVPSWYL